MLHQRCSIIPFLAATTFGLAACGQSHQAQAPKPGEAGMQLVQGSELTLNEYMAHLMQHNARETWKWQGEIIDENGTRTTYPTNDEEWEKAESAALTLVQLSYALDQKSFGHPMDEWKAGISELRNSAKEIAKAAEFKKTEAFVAGGDRMADACLSCHYRFAPHLELPRSK
jgi:hypothetical protein